MTSRRPLYRSRNALVGGVCAGIAQRLNIDPVIVRIFFVAFTFITFGLTGFLYLALWAVLPKEPKRVKPVVVEPQSVHSDTFGVVDCRSARRRYATSARCAQPASYVGAAHLPPTPPSVARQMDGSEGVDAPRTSDQAFEQVPEAKDEMHRPSWILVACALVAGSLLVSVGVSLAIAALVRGVSWWQCWPLSLVVLGIMRMAIPGGKRARAAAFLLGVTLSSVGFLLLPMSTGVVAWESIEVMTERLWPLLVGAVALLALGLRECRTVPILIAALLIVAFCALGLAFYAEPGSLHELSFVTPLGREHSIVLPFALFR